jgi:hypothetical protein
MVLHSLPNTLIFQLNRFEFDYDTMSRTKVDDRFEFPVEEILDLEFLMRETFAKREIPLQSTSEMEIAEEKCVNFDEGFVTDDLNESEEQQEDVVGSGNPPSSTPPSSTPPSSTPPSSKPAPISKTHQQTSSGSSSSSNKTIDKLTAASIVNKMSSEMSVQGISIDPKLAKKPEIRKGKKSEPIKGKINTNNNPSTDSKTEVKDKSQPKSPKEKENLRHRPSGYYKYRLVGIIVHSGSAESGHYFSYIHERGIQPGSSSSQETSNLISGSSRGDGQEVNDNNRKDNNNCKNWCGRWLCFNDDTVTPYNPNHITKDCFGVTPEKDQKWKWSESAYLLFYDRFDKYLIQNR